MYSRIIREEVPLFYEIIFDETAMSILLSLCPEASGYFMKMLEQTNRIVEYFESKEKFSQFVFPKEGSWGFGGVFKMNNSKSIEKGWTTWECLLPRKTSHSKLNEIAGNIYQFISLMQLFDHDPNNRGIESDKLQLMTIDGLMVTSDSHFHGGGFNFSFARPVLEFCKNIWNEDERIHNEIIGAMEKMWMHLMGEKKMKSYNKHSFRISVSQGDSRLVSLSCPGQCA